MENNPYATHRPVLLKLLNIIDKSKPILELGCGLGSTPILHEFASKNKVKLFTLDNNTEWLSKIEAEFPTNETHTYKKIHNWSYELEDFINLKYSLVFIDQSPWEARTLSLNLFKNISDYVVLHDCDYFPANNIFGKQSAPIVSHDNVGKREYFDVFKNYIEYFPKFFAAPSGPPTLLGSQFYEINFEI
jgi:hypothetical protein